MRTHTQVVRALAALRTLQQAGGLKGAELVGCRRTLVLATQRVMPGAWGEELAQVRVCVCVHRACAASVYVCGCAVEWVCGCILSQCMSLDCCSTAQ